VTGELVPARRVTPEVLAYHQLKATDPMAGLVVLLADRYGLDPLLNHVEVLKTKAGPKLYITRDGYLDIAHRSGQLDGIVLDEVRRGNTGWAATVSIWRKDMRYPFTYSAGCGDDEAQAEAGNGEEMAIARAERRALKRAFPVLVAADNMLDGVQGGQTPEAIDLKERPEPVGPRWHPSSGDQRDAHKAIGALGDNERQIFLEQWDIETFSEVWPAGAVADALGIELEP
jgi:hypothetical protein